MDYQVWLPLELWTMTFQTIADTSPWSTRLSNVRLTCKLFANLAAPFLLPRIICGPLSNPLATLTDVSRHPAISRSVREFIYTCHQYSSIENLSDYKVALRRTFHKICWTEFRRGEYRPEQSIFAILSALQWSDCCGKMWWGHSHSLLCSNADAKCRKDRSSPKYYCCEAKELSSRYFLGPEPDYNKTFLLLARVLSFTGAKIRKIQRPKPGRLWWNWWSGVWRNVST